MPRAGQCLSTEAIEQMKLSKLKRMQKKYDWSLIEPFLDVEINKSSRNRQLKFITLREFKEMILDGLGMQEIKQKGISKHLLQFYSSFVQGKISISKEKFVEEYEKGLSLEEIALKYNISKDSITFLRQLYEISSKGATFINRKNTEIPLTLRQKEILYGSMMGDAKKVSSSAVGFGHGEKQKDYLLWKYKEFENIASKHSLQGISYIDKRSEYEGKTWRFYTYANTDVEKCIMEFYRSGTKQISRDMLNNLSPLSIAVWYQDDGKIDHGHGGISKNNYDITPQVTFCTESFSKESCEEIKKWFKEEYNINVRLKEKLMSNMVGYRVIVCNDSVKDFIDIIDPYILPMFKYKVHYDKYLEKREANETKVVMGDIVSCPLGVDFNNLSSFEQDRYIDNIVEYFQRKGIYSLIGSPSELQNHMSYVFSSNPENLLKNDHISFSNIGNRFLMSHFTNFWKGRAKGGKSPKEIFENKKYLSEIIRSIVARGVFPNDNEILKNLRRYRGNKILSGFMPCVAKSIYHKYCEPNSKVLDFCAGYGGRLFGAVACEKVSSYNGIEVNFETYMNLRELHKNLRIFADCKKEVNLLNGDGVSTMKMFADKAFDFCFTSPPYYDAEEYSDDDSQSSNKYDSYGKWFNNFLIKCIDEAVRVSKRVAINIANTGGYKIADDLEKHFKLLGIKYNVDYLKVPYYGKIKREPIFVIEE